MVKPYLLIGIGTSGLRVIEQVQRFYYEMTGQNKPANVQYVYIETDESARPEATAKENEIKRIFIDLSQRTTLINGLRSNSDINTEWVPESGSIAQTGAGACGISAFGRIALWGADNYNRIYSGINNAFSELNTHSNLITDGKPVIFVTGTFAGGTGSGIFIDIAYMVRKIIAGAEELYGLFLIPPITDYNKMQKELQNTFTSINGLHTINNIPTNKSKYDERLPNGQQANFVEPPYELVQFISQDYHEAQFPSISNLAGLYKIAGLYLFLNTFGLYERRQALLVNAKGAGHIEHYGTFGISAIQYPKSQIEEYAAISLSTELLKRWTDSQSYYLQGQKVGIEQQSVFIADETKKEFDSIINRAFESLNNIKVEGGAILIEDIKKQATIINKGKKQHGATSDEEYITNLFSPNTTNKYYQAIQTNVQEAIDVVIESINQYISSQLDITENLKVVQLQLQAFADAILDCIQNYWHKELKITSNPNDWNGVLSKQIRRILDNRYGWLGEADNVVNDRLLTTLDLLKMHLIGKRLHEIKKNIDGSDNLGSPLRSKINNIELPTILTIKNLANTLQAVIGQKDSGGTLSRRHNEIANDIEDKTIPMLRVFTQPNFEKEIEIILATYRTKKQAIVSKTTLIGNANLWEYLTKSKDDKKRQIYSDCIANFSRELRDNNCLPNYDIANYVNNNLEETIKIAKRSNSPLVRINRNNNSRWQGSNNIPRMVISADNTTISRTLERFKGQTYNDFDHNQNILALQGLGNMIVFFDEKGWVNEGSNRPFQPLQDIFYIPDIEAKYEEFIQGISDPIQKEEELKKCNPYIYHILRQRGVFK